MKDDSTNTTTVGFVAPRPSVSGPDCEDAGRRIFLRALTATTAALAVGACAGGATESAGGVPSTPGTTPSPNPNPGVNRAPVWQTIPTITFTQGVAATFSIAGFVSDPDGDPLTITLGSGTLPPGVTYDAVNKRFVYDGVGAVGSTGGHVLTADDGRG